MNRYLVVLFLVLNVVLMYGFWRYWIQIKQLKQDREAEFVPTKEWQQIDKNQAIPKGLHVRINLQTGEREAKLLSNEEDEKKDFDRDTSVVLLEENVEGYSSQKNTKYELLRESLKNIRNEMPAMNVEEDKNRVSSKFRTYEELKKDLSQLKLQVKTDMEVLHEAVENFNKVFNKKDIDHQKEDELISILKDLEYLLHQVDNAKEFAKINGISEVIVPSLIANSTFIRTAAARALGSATQNNAAVQIASLKAGVISPLLKNIALEKNYQIRSSSIYALSCLVRGFPIAEVKLMEEGGLSVLLSLFDENSADGLKLQLKVVNFFNDLLVEREDAKLTLEEDKLLTNVTEPAIVEEIKIMTEKLRQYNSVGLYFKLVERGWCSKLNDLLVNKVIKKQGSDITEEYIDHEVADTVLNAISAVSTECETQFKNDKSFGLVLKNLRDDYKFLLNNDKDSFFNDIYDLIDKLYSKFVI